MQLRLTKNKDYLLKLDVSELAYLSIIMKDLKKKTHNYPFSLDTREFKNFPVEININLAQFIDKFDSLPIEVDDQ